MKINPRRSITDIKISTRPASETRQQYGRTSRIFVPWLKKWGLT